MKYKYFVQGAKLAAVSKRPKVPAVSPEQRRDSA